MADYKKSPLEKLVDFHRENCTLPVKVSPKNRLEERQNVKIITPIVEDAELPFDPAEIPFDLRDPNNLVISNSSLTINFNLSVDSEAMDKAFEKSVEIAKKVAAAGAAVIGTAILFGGSNKKDIKKVKIPLKPKVKVPKFKD
jgi:hypothetical protein